MTASYYSSVTEVATVDSGPAFKSSQFGEVGDGVPLLRGENIEPGALRWAKTRTWPESFLSGYEHLLVQAGDLILGMDRPVISAGLKLAMVRPGDVPALLVQRVARIRPKSIDGRYLYLWLSSEEFIQHLQRSATGTQLPHVNLSSIREFQVPRFGEDAERRIVDLLEYHLSRLDAATLDLQHAAQRARSLFESSVLLMFQKNRGRDTTLGRIATWGSGGTPSARTAAYYAGGTIPWVNSGDLADGPVSGAPKKITEQGLRASSAKWVPEGSVLVAMYGATIGKTGFTTGPVTTNQAIAFATPSSAVAGAWLQWFLRSQGPLLRKAGKGGAQPNISQTILKDWPLSLPSLEVQHAQAQSAAALEAHLLRLHAAVTSAQNRTVALRLSLLAAAFSGCLTGAESHATSTDVIEELAGG